MTRDMLLTGARVVRRDGSVSGPCSVLVKSGKIAEVGEDVGTAGAPRPVVVDCSGCFVSPGLVNLHTHSPMTVLRGIAEDVSIEDWFNVRIFPYESNLTRDDVKVGALLAIHEMVESGVTAFFDHYFMAEEIVAACKETGIRADIAPTIFGFGDWKAALRASADLVDKVNGEGGTVRARLGPHAPYTCPPPVLKACASAAREAGVGVHIHVSETDKQVLESIAQYGSTPFRVMYEAGLMEAECVLAHGTFMREDDVPLVSNRAFLAVAPKTYLKLASGAGNLYNVLRFLGYPGGDSPVTVGIGTDGAASSATQGPLEQARMFALLGKDRSGDATAFDLRTIWRTMMAGHDALHQGTGDIAAGYVADLVVWDLKRAPTWPIVDEDDPQAILAAIVYSADGRNVRDVLVGGRFLKRAGHICCMDSREVMARAASSRRRLLALGAGTARVKY